jgi:hypothetical protein
LTPKICDFGISARIKEHAKIKTYGTGTEMFGAPE